MATSRTPERTSERTPSTRVSRGRIAIIIAAVVAVLALIATIVIISVRSAASDGTTSAQTASEGAPSALPDSTAMGAIELNVSNLEIMRNYYEGAVGLQALSEPESTEQPSTEQPSTEQSSTEQSNAEQLNTVELGLDVPLIQLRATAEGEQTATPTEAGLYHSAILYPDEATLARTQRVSGRSPSPSAAPPLPKSRPYTSFQSEVRFSKGTQRCLLLKLRQPGPDWPPK